MRLYYEGLIFDSSCILSASYKDVFKRNSNLLYTQILNNRCIVDTIWSHPSLFHPLILPYLTLSSFPISPSHPSLSHPFLSHPLILPYLTLSSFPIISYLILSIKILPYQISSFPILTLNTIFYHILSFPMSPYRTILSFPMLHYLIIFILFGLSLPHPTLSHFSSSHLIPLFL